jgi:hypothetical protein
LYSSYSAWQESDGKECQRVILFRKLFGFPFAKSFPFWTTFYACKDTKFSIFKPNFTAKKSVKEAKWNSFGFFNTQ